MQKAKWSCAHTHSGAFARPWILPRAKKCPPDTFCTSARTGAALSNHISSSANNKSHPNGWLLLLAEDEGFEPPQTESESGVLPLHKSSIARTFIIIHKHWEKSRGFSKFLFFLSPVRITTFLRFILSFPERVFLPEFPAAASEMSPVRPYPGAWSGYIPAAFWYWDASDPVPGFP